MPDFVLGQNFSRKLVSLNKVNKFSLLATLSFKHVLSLASCIQLCLEFVQGEGGAASVFFKALLIHKRVVVTFGSRIYA